MVKDTHKIRANVAQVSHSTSESIKRKIFDFEDYLFEKKYSLELSGIVENKNLVKQIL